MKVAIAGDWHGNTGWVLPAIDKIAVHLKDEPEDEKLIIQLGDFGIWPGPSGVKYRQKLTKRLEKHGINVVFVDGNHEKFPYLYKQAAEQDLSEMGNLVRITDRIFWAQRGYAFQLGGKEWLAAGGGVSLDRQGRKEGKSWWPEEFIMQEQLDFIKSKGHADVVIAHDCPSCVTLRFKGTDWPMRELAKNERHREIMQEIADSAKPDYWLHGHMHFLYERTVNGTRYTGLARDTMDGNWIIMDAETMEWLHLGLVKGN